jgi:hypothetical protein
VVVQIFITDPVLCTLRCNLKECLDIWVGVGHTPVELCQTEVSQYFETPDHFPNAFEVKAEAELALLIVKGGSILVPAFELCVVPEEVVEEMF